MMAVEMVSETSIINGMMMEMEKVSMSGVCPQLIWLVAQKYFIVLKFSSAYGYMFNYLFS
jgi:hypothetical protein